jgi:hypothetical protein
MAELSAHGYDSPRGKEALRVINRAHGRFAISNDDMRYVLSTFVYDPIGWIDRYGWRRLHEHERLAAFHFYRQVGLRMGIRDIPEDFSEFRTLKREYEREHFVFAETNAEIGWYTVDLLCSWYPKPFRPMAREAARSLLDPQMLTAFGFAPAARWVSLSVRGALHARAAVVALLPPRRVSRLGRDPGNRTYPGYPDDYSPSELGAPPPPADLDPTLLAR